MRFLISLILVIIFCPFQILAQDSVSVSDFRYPETRAIDLKGGLSGQIQGDDSKSTATTFTSPDEIRDHNTRSSLGGVFTNFLYFHSTELHENLFTLQANFGYRGQRNESSQDVSPSYQFSNSSAEQKTLKIGASWRYLHYKKSDGLHYIGGLSFSDGLFYNKNNYYDIHSSFPHPTSYESGSRQNSLNSVADLGIGYGRMRDGSFVFQALRVIEKLREDGVITKEINHEGWLVLIDKIAHKREYTTNYERYAKFLGRDIIETMIAEGIARKEDVTYYSAYRVEEAVRENINQRFFGWRVFYLVERSDVQSSFTINGGSSSSPEQSYKNYYYLHQLGGEWGYSLSLYTHVNANVKLQLPTSDLRAHASTNASISILHQVGEKIDVTGSYQYSNSSSYRDTQQFSEFQGNEYRNVQASFAYYIEDQVSFTTTMSYLISNDHFFNHQVTGLDFPTGTEHSAFQIQFSLTYNII